MGGQVQISGNITLGQGTATSSAFPSTFAAAQLGLLPNPKSYDVAAGVLTKTVASPLAFVPLGVVGPTSQYQVSECLTFYLRSESPFDLRITQDDGIGGSTISTIPVHGTYLQETPELKAITFIEIKGEGLIEYLVAGKD